MKPLVVFYSRTGMTRALAKAICKKLKCDCEEIVDAKNRYGPIGYIVAGKDAVMRKHTVINSIKKDIKDHDLIIIGTPVWASNMAPAIRTFINRNKRDFKKVAFFVTFGASGADKTIKELEHAAGIDSIASLLVRSGEVARESYVDKLKAFSDKLRKAVKTRKK